MKEFSIVVATDAHDGIGKEGKLPWHLPGDLKYFREITTKTRDPDKQNAVFMGRKTWESIPENFRPLAKRVNLVLTRRKDIQLPKGILRAQSFSEAFDVLENSSDSIERVFVIGGGELYKEALKHEECTTLYITQILHSFDCDTHFPDYRLNFERTEISRPQKDANITYYFSEYHRKSV